MRFTAYTALYIVLWGLCSLVEGVNPGVRILSPIWVPIFISGATTFLTLLFVITDYKKKIKGFHWKRAIYRPILISLAPLSIGVLLPFGWGYTIAFIVSQLALFGVMFDPLLNISHNKPHEYAGTEAGWDRIVNTNKSLFLILEVLMLVFSSHFMYASLVN